jgi:hypothetical protein
MEIQSLQIIAGSISSFLFISGNIPMLVKAFKSRNLRSYSLSNIVLVNAGNLAYWIYVSNLPFGPIWVLHSFYTVAEVLMLFWYLRFEFPRTPRHVLVASGAPLGTKTYFSPLDSPVPGTCKVKLSPGDTLKIGKQIAVSKEEWT